MMKTRVEGAREWWTRCRANNGPGFASVLRKCRAMPLALHDNRTCHERRRPAESRTNRDKPREAASDKALGYTPGERLIAKDLPRRR